MSHSNSGSRPRPLALVALLMLAVAQPLAAQRAFTSFTVFGDSFSDTGNLQDLTGGAIPPSPPYFDGRFSNGLVWTDYFASRIGRPGDANPAFLTRTNTGNYAVAGALTVNPPGAPAGTPPSMQQQLGNWATRPGGATVDAAGLYTYFGGANDIRFAGGLAEAAQRNAVAIAAAQNLAAGAGALAAAGAQFILLPYIVNLGLTPEAQLNGRSAVLGELSALFNQTLAQELGVLRGAFGSTMFFDLRLDNLFTNVIADAQNGGAQYGITDVTRPCLPPFAPPGASPCDVSLFADALHPTTRGHQLVSDAAYNLVAFDRNVAVVPEPSTWALMGFGLVSLAAARRKRSA